MKKNRGLIVLCICSLLIGLIGCGQPEVTEAWEADQIKRLTSIAATTFFDENGGSFQLGEPQADFDLLLGNAFSGQYSRVGCI